MFWPRSAVALAPEPLAGQTVWLTRDAGGNEAWRPGFERAGARVVCVPCVAIAPIAVEDLPGRLAAANWLVLTSPTTARILASHMGSRPWPAQVRVAVVGPATLEAAQALGWRVDVVANPPDGEGLAVTLTNRHVLTGSRVLLPHSELADPGLPQRLRQAGAAVDDLVLYRNLAPPGLAEAVLNAAVATPPAWIAFASGSAFSHWLAAWPKAMGLNGVRLAAIGRRTAQVLAAAGHPASAVAAVPESGALVAAMAAAPPIQNRG